MGGGQVLDRGGRPVVAQQLLHLPQRHPALVAVGCAGVAQKVGMEVPDRPGEEPVAGDLQRPSEGRRRHRQARRRHVERRDRRRDPLGGEQRRMGIVRVVAELAPDVLHVPPQQRPAVLEQVGLALAGARSARPLAVDQKPAPLARLPVEVPDPHPAQLGGPHPRDVGELAHHVVPARDRGLASLVQGVPPPGEELPGRPL